MVQNTMNLARKANSVIDAKYDIFANNINDIYQESDSVWDMIVNGFLSGYMQGVKAAKAEMKKGGASDE